MNSTCHTRTDHTWTGNRPGGPSPNRRRARLGVAALLAVLALSSAACSNAIEGIANQALEDQGVEVDLESGSVSVENADGTTTTAGVGVPDDFPADFPLPDGAEPAGGFATNVGGFALAVPFNVPGATVDEIAAFYETALPDAGYEIESTTGGDANTVHTLTTGDLVAINPAIEGQDVLVTVSFVDQPR